MKKLLFGALLLTLVAAGCAITSYPTITDARGDFAGTIRTGHKAYIIPSGQVGTLWPDGSDELFSLVYQNNYGDKKIYTFNNQDPTQSIIFLDQTYCDWRYEGCEITRAWDPAPPRPNDVFDYEYFPSCSGSRSLSLLVSYGSRYMGECGDGVFGVNNKQTLFGVFANLATTSWRGETAYVLPIDASNTLFTLNGVAVPLYGTTTGFITERLQLVIPVTANLRPTMRWLSQFASENGSRVNATIQYQDLSTEVSAALVQNGLIYNLGRM